MSPIPPYLHSLESWKRDIDENGDCVGFCDGGYVRWVIAIIIIVGLMIIIFLFWMWSVKRVTGKWGIRRSPLPGTTGPGVMNNSSRRHRRRRGHNSQNIEEADPVPVYNATLGQDDAGYYDPHGNYVAFEPPPYEPPKAVLRGEEVELDRITTDADDASAIDPRGEVVGHFENATDSPRHHRP